MVQQQRQATAPHSALLHRHPAVPPPLPTLGMAAAGVALSDSADSAQPDWAALPPELLHLCFAQLGEALNAEHAEGVPAEAAQRLLAAVSVNRAWRAAALEAVSAQCRRCLAGAAYRCPHTACDYSPFPATLASQVHLHLLCSTLAALGCPAVLAWRCTELRLPTLRASMPDGVCAALQAAMRRLLRSPAFQRRSSGCLSAVYAVPLGVAASGALAAFPLLRHVEIVDDCCSLDAFHDAAALAAPRCFPPSLHSLAVPAPLVAAGLAVPRSLQCLQPHSQTFLSVGKEMLAACASISATAGRTVTLLLDALTASRRCRELSVEAKYAVFSTPSPAACAALAGHSGALEALPLADAQLAAWLRVLAPALTPSGLRRICITACDVNLFCYTTGNMAVLRPGRWCQPSATSVMPRGGWVAEVAWPAPAHPPAFFRLTLTRLDCPEE